MKRTIAKAITPIICSALLLAGCTAKQATEKAAQSEQSATQTAVTDWSTVSTNLSQTTEQASSGKSTGQLFSERDISGEYDSVIVKIQLNGTTVKASDSSVSVSGSDVTINSAGTYILSGTLDNGSITVNAAKEDKVQLVLDGVSITSNNFAAIYVKQADKVFITLKDGTKNILSTKSFIQRDDYNVDAVIFARDDITLNGNGSLTVTSPVGHGIVGKDEVTITGGTYNITASQHAIRANDSIAVSGGVFTLTANEDGLHAENKDDATLGNVYITGGEYTINVGDDAIHAFNLLQIDGGTINITAAEGLEGTCVRINNGNIDISATDDGINAAKQSGQTPTVEFNGGEVTIAMGPGDTDGVDSNGNIIVNGGTISVTGNSTFDYDGTAEKNGGTIIVNGSEVDSIPNQMMGGGMGGGFHGGMGGMRGPRM